MLYAVKVWRRVGSKRHKKRTKKPLPEGYCADCKRVGSFFVFLAYGFLKLNVGIGEVEGVCEVSTFGEVYAYFFDVVAGDVFGERPM